MIKQIILILNLIYASFTLNCDTCNDFYSKIWCNNCKYIGLKNFLFFDGIEFGFFFCFKF